MSQLDMLDLIKKVWTSFLNCFSFKKTSPMEPQEVRGLGDGYSLSKSRITRGLTKFMEEEDDKG